MNSSVPDDLLTLNRLAGILASNGSPDGSKIVREKLIQLSEIDEKISGLIKERNLCLNKYREVIQTERTVPFSSPPDVPADLTKRTNILAGMLDKDLQDVLWSCATQFLYLSSRWEKLVRQAERLLISQPGRTPDFKRKVEFYEWLEKCKLVKPDSPS
jgi:hypothetical protein